MGLTERLNTMNVDSAFETGPIAPPLRINANLKPNLPTSLQSQKKLHKYAAYIAEAKLDTVEYLQILENTKSKIIETYWEIVSKANSLEESLGVRDEERLKQICTALELRYDQAEEEHMVLFLRSGSRHVVVSHAKVKEVSGKRVSKPLLCDGFVE